MDYHPVNLCIRTIVETEVPGRYLIDMPSLWRPNQAPLNVDAEAVAAVTGGKYDVPMCPPGWPNPPVAE